ncbi:hypothetical protein TRIP_B20005 [uncultured Desulfatiglans sp.]|nr:hypothetical protein TRIP_B20005 [uncultured Desulfatiglans sp.]
MRRLGRPGAAREALEESRPGCPKQIPLGDGNSDDEQVELKSIISSLTRDVKIKEEG